MDLLKAIAGRRSIRSFKKQDLPDGAIEKIVDAARLAPSAGNAQPYEFVVAQEEKPPSSFPKQPLIKETFKRLQW